LRVLAADLAELHSSWLADMAEESEDAALRAQACAAATRGEVQAALAAYRTVL
jgi:hypothetical protein